ncbi:hypothetical protein DL764_010895 [Monosporascus ibericus]|uniref:EthD domain-containing protein n=1 Tax=Monosporascus ibericus TaxID=155417 RepID=A0A4Q4SS00_9PEZI|nr:hypothetical protein DL764_010895 [Monosporascus ibericus]
MAAAAVIGRPTTGICGMWNGTKDDQEAYVDFSTGNTNINPPLEINCEVQDIRITKRTFAESGYELVDHQTKMTPEDFLNGKDDKTLLESAYFQECKDLSVKPGGFATKDVGVSSLPIAHCDRDPISGASSLRDALGAEEVKRMMKVYPRFAQVSVWRGIGQTISRRPLLLIDTKECETWDYETHLAKIFPTNDPRVAIRGQKPHDSVLKHDPGYRYFYASDMRVDEALVFSSFDSVKSKVVPHGAFWDNSTQDDTPARRSIEVRTWAFFEDAE